MNKLNVGDYVRTRDGDIGKTIEKYKGVSGSTIYKIDRETEDFDYTNVFDWGIEKSSPNIIDLIEVGDYVNGYYVEDITHNTEEYILHIITGSNYFQSPILYNDDIKSIVTHEQFSQMEYKVGEIDG